MNVSVDKLLVNRSSLTRTYRTAGAPLTQMHTHIPIIDMGARSSFKQSTYNLIRKPKGHTPESLKALIESIKLYGIREPIDAWEIGDGYYEIYGGHHRAVIAHILGIKEIPVKIKPFSAYHYMSSIDIEYIKQLYSNVCKTESLKTGQSYNYFPGLYSIRKSVDRLTKIYRDIITCSGNRLIDLGCNDGYFGVGLSLHDFDITFVDRSLPYLKVAEAKMKAIKQSSRLIHDSLGRFDSTFDVSIYLDVFYHTILEKGVETAYWHLQSIINNTNERLIFAPGRWDKLEKAGCSQKHLFNILQKRAKQIRYLGKDTDDGYGREIYSIYY